jgi:hypothetical protein
MHNSMMLSMEPKMQGAMSLDTPIEPVTIVVAIIVAIL